MCGFLGELSNKLSPEKAFTLLLALSSHRGPDQNASWSDGRLCRLGFNRLSILDTSERGKQPIISPSGRYVFVFNGEVYNYKDLQRQYAIPDASLRSHADSEVIAHLLEKMPIIKMAEQLNGMFSIGVYDQLEKTVTLLRDFAGIKPLFYGITAGTLVFASQFDQVFKHPIFKQQLQVDPAGLYDYAALGYMPAPRTVFSHIHQCLPGEWVQVNAQMDVKKGFFRLWHPKAPNKHEPELDLPLNTLDAAFEKVVKDQLVSDVPVGLFLSGGIDSPLIAAYAVAHKPDVTAYTIGLEGNEMDEAPQAAIYAKALGLKHNIAAFTEADLLRETDAHFSAYAEPFGDYSSLPTHLITAIARRENTVMLSGDGGDELFWGYPRFLTKVDHFPWFKYPLLLRKTLAGVRRRTGKSISYAVSSEASIPSWVLHQQCHNKPNELKRLLPGLFFSNDLEGIYAAPNKLNSKEDLLQYLRWNEFYGHMQRVLVKVDRSSMGNSLEVRVPFLDQRIIDLAWSITPSLGIHHREPKYLLKALLQKKLGDTPIYKPKKGFGVPIRQWLQGPLKKDLQNHLLDTPLFAERYWNKPALEQKLRLFLEKDIGNEWGIWILYAMQKWAKQAELV